MSEQPAPKPRRVGIHNRPGGKVTIFNPKFGPALDEPVVNDGDMTIDGVEQPQS